MNYVHIHRTRIEEAVLAGPVLFGQDLGPLVGKPSQLQGNRPGCAPVLDRDVADIMTAEPQAFPQPCTAEDTKTATGSADPEQHTVIPKRRDGRSLPPV